MTPDERADEAVAAVSARTDESEEYERTAVVTARVEGPDGPTRVWRRYEGLPRHNDVVAPGEVDVDDDLVERPDEVHVHTKWYEPGDAADDGDGAPGESDGDHEEPDEYVRDAHETWRPEDPGVLGDPDDFCAAARDHALATLGDATGPAEE